MDSWYGSFGSSAPFFSWDLLCRCSSWIPSPLQDPRVTPSHSGHQPLHQQAQVCCAVLWPPPQCTSWHITPGAWVYFTRHWIAGSLAIFIFTFTSYCQISLKVIIPTYTPNGKIWEFLFQTPPDTWYSIFLKKANFVSLMCVKSYLFFKLTFSLLIGMSLSFFL